MIWVPVGQPWTCNICTECPCQCIYSFQTTKFTGIFLNFQLIFVYSNCFNNAVSSILLITHTYHLSKSNFYFGEHVTCMCPVHDLYDRVVYPQSQATLTHDHLHVAFPTQTEVLHFVFDTVDKYIHVLFCTTVFVLSRSI